MDGDFEEVTIRWRLDPEIDWQITSDGCTSPLSSLRMTCAADDPLAAMQLTEGWESLHYLQRSRVPVLEFRAGRGAKRIETEIKLHD